MSRQSLRRCVVGILVTSLVACDARRSPVEPAVRAIGAPAHIGGDARLSAPTLVRRSDALRADVVRSETITPAGGMLRLEEAGLLVLFPSGAVSENLVVTATARRGDGIYYEFEPHGVRFNTPILIAQELGLLSYVRRRGELCPAMHGGYVGTAQNGEAMGILAFTETFPTRYARHGAVPYVQFATTHFSAYALATGRDGESPDSSGDGS